MPDWIGRVRDNLLGNPGFSPQVHLTSATVQALDLDVGARIEQLEGQFSADLVQRSAVWLTVKESRASFAIEHEEDNRDRVQRFAAVMEQRTGRAVDPLAPAELEALQREILGPRSRPSCDGRTCGRSVISGKLRAEYPVLADPQIAEDVLRTVREELPAE